MNITKLHNLLEFAAKIKPPNCIVEIGVFKGDTLKRIAQITNPEVKIFGYDTFEGLPPATEEDNYYKGGELKSNQNEVAEKLSPFKNVTLVKGIFPESAVPMPPIGMCNLDVDLYAQVKNCAKFLIPLMAPGGRLFFDDVYWHAVKGGTQAYFELCKEFGRTPIKKHAYFDF